MNMRGRDFLGTADFRANELRVPAWVLRGGVASAADRVYATSRTETQ